MTSILYMLYFSQSCDFSFLVRSRGTRKLFMRIVSRRDSLTSFFILLYMIASRLVPLIPVWEVQEGQMAHSLTKFGRETVVTVSELE